MSVVVLDALSMCSTGVAGWLAESRCVKREVSRPQVADGYGHGSCEGQLLDADMGPQRRLRSTSGLPSRHGTAMWLGCYGDAMRRRWEGVVVRGARGLTFTENGPFTMAPVSTRCRANNYPMLPHVNRPHPLRMSTMSL